MTTPLVAGLTARAQPLVTALGFRRSTRDRSGLAAHLAVLGLPAHPIALELDARFGGLASPRVRHPGWLALGVFEALDGSAPGAADRIAWLEGSEEVDATWPHVRGPSGPLLVVGDGCDTVYLADDQRLLVLDAMLDELRPGPTSPSVFVEQRLRALAMSVRRLQPDVATWDTTRDAIDLDRTLARLSLSPVPEASDAHQAWWERDEVFAVATGRQVRIVAPAAVLAGAGMPTPDYQGG